MLCVGLSGIATARTSIVLYLFTQQAADTVFHRTVINVNKIENMNAQSQSSDDASVLDRIIKWDKSLSRRLALCSSADAPCGYLRPYMRLLEYSCHGVLWFVGVAAMLLMTHQFEMQQKLLNLFSSEYDILNSHFTKVLKRT